MRAVSVGKTDTVFHLLGVHRPSLFTSSKAIPSLSLLRIESLTSRTTSGGLGAAAGASLRRRRIRRGCSGIAENKKTELIGGSLDPIYWVVARLAWSSCLKIIGQGGWHKISVTFYPFVVQGAQETELLSGNIFLLPRERGIISRFAPGNRHVVLVCTQGPFWNSNCPVVWVRLIDHHFAYPPHALDLVSDVDRVLGVFVSEVKKTHVFETMRRQGLQV